MAQDILSQIRAGGAVGYDRVLVGGDLDLSLLGPGDFRVKSLCITNSSLGGMVFLENLTVDGPVDFRETEFQKDSFFRGCRFQEAEFPHTIFRGYADFSSCTFQSPANYVQAAFDGDTDFSYSQFSRDVNFNFAQFNTDFVYFDGTTFLGNASFKGIRFGKYVYFSAARFEKAADFLFADFDGNCLFSDVRFLGDVNLESVQFKGYAIFGNTHFQGELLLAGASINNMMMPGVTFGEQSRIYLNNSDVHRLLASWSDIRDHLVFQGAVYLALVENYKDVGWFQDADECYYQYRRLAQEEKAWGWSRLFDLLAWVSCGYGVRPGYTVAWSLLLILLCGAVFFAGRGIRPSSRSEEPPQNLDRHEATDASGYAPEPDRPS
ncbi:MAG: pentapeptide repeat-containing protein, partial [Methanosarcinales archaeon]|nr:pentapeptide repeat-containing protein [Methanosarcinales archaeon]